MIRPGTRAAVAHPAAGQRAKVKGKWGGAVNRQVAVVALSGAFLFWLLFVMLVGIPQPAGFWPSLF